MGMVALSPGGPKRKALDYQHHILHTFSRLKDDSCNLFGLSKFAHLRRIMVALTGKPVVGAFRLPHAVPLLKSTARGVHCTDCIRCQE
jgi:hypothetical protein